jgi:hypothetical protein
MTQVRPPISMMPAAYSYAWTNVRDCLHALTGCFTGHAESHLQIGEFHGIITLDNGETIRAIIPECIQVPNDVSHTCLLADTAFLMAGHQTSAIFQNLNRNLKVKVHIQFQSLVGIRSSRSYPQQLTKRPHTEPFTSTLTNPTTPLRS